MSDASRRSDYEDAFHHAAERHERIWVFLSITLLTLLLAGTLFFVVADYGVVTRTASLYSNPAAPPLADFKAGRIVQTGPHAYSVDMQAHLWGWTPSPLHIPQGASVTFFVTSADVLHGFEVQDTTINMTAIPGIVGSVTYTFDHAGAYHIICNEYCGIEHQAMIGQIMVDAKVAG